MGCGTFFFLSFFKRVCHNTRTLNNKHPSMHIIVIKSETHPLMHTIMLKSKAHRHIPLSFNGIYKVAVAVQRQRVIYTENSGFASPARGSAHFHVSWLSDFIFYQKPLYKSLHQ